MALRAFVKMKVITQDKKLLDNFAMMLELTDEELQFIKENPDKFLTMEVMQKLMLSKGNNAHIVQLTLDENISIRFYAAFLLSKYKTVSWFNREHKFSIIGEKKCPQ